MAKDKYGRKLPPGISYRNDGRYMARLQYKGKRYTIYGETVTECKSKLTNLKYELERGLYCAPERMSLDKWFQTWLDVYKVPTVKSGTVKTYLDCYDAYIRKPLGKLNIADISAEQLQDLLNKMAREDFSDKTISLVYSILYGLFGYAFKLSYIPKNPCLYVIRPKGTATKEKVCLTEKQTKIFLEYSKESWLDNLFQLCLYTGMRGGEARALTWADIDFKRRIIHVQHTLLENKGGGYSLDTPKTKTSVRDIPIMDSALKVLKDQKAYYDGFRAEKITPIRNTDFVFFQDTDNTPVLRGRVNYEIKRMLKEMRDNGVEFPKFTLHSLRHTFATRCAEAGMNLQVLQKILGHATFTMTADLYGGHVVEERKIKEIEKVSDAFNIAI